jgi:hypothetical protein
MSPFTGEGMIVIADEFDVARSQQEWSRFIADNAAAYLEKGERRLVAYAWAYNDALSKRPFLAVVSPESKKALGAANVFWREFETYRVRCAPGRSTN